MDPIECPHCMREFLLARPTFEGLVTRNREAAMQALQVQEKTAPRSRFALTPKVVEDENGERVLRVERTG